MKTVVLVKLPKIPLLANKNSQTISNDMAGSLEGAGSFGCYLKKESLLDLVYDDTCTISFSLPCKE